MGKNDFLSKNSDIGMDTKVWSDSNFISGPVMENIHLVRIKNEYGDIISMKERPTGAEKLQTNF